MNRQTPPHEPPSCPLIDSSLLQEFVADARDHLDRLEPDLLALEKGAAALDPEIINRVFRAIHSIKGSAALVGLEALRDFSHLVENVLLRIREGELSPNPSQVDVLLAAVDKLRQMVEASPACEQVERQREIQDLAALQAGPRADQACAAEGPSQMDDEAHWAQALAGETPPGTAPNLADRGGPAPTEGRWVLVVEDNKVAARLLREKIAAETEFSPLVAYSLAEARQALEEDRARFFVAVLDLNLPDAPAGEVVDLALEHHLPAIILTATFDDHVRERILAKRVVDYVVKSGLKDLDYVAHLLMRLLKNQGVKVLVVDDVRGIRESLRGLLLLHRYQVVVAEDGEQALAVMEANPDIKVVITDYNMPRMDGLRLVSRLRDLHSKQRLAIIGMSAEDRGTLSAKFLKSGANDFLSKPFLSEEFHCRVSQNVELLELIQQMDEASHRDFLTNLFNRRYFFMTGRQLHQDALSQAQGLAAGMIDIDHFKKINDTYGHAAGDTALRHIANLLREIFQDQALVARVGGEEFCVLASGLDRPGALVRFNELRKAVERAEIRSGDQAFRLTVSVGLTTEPGPSLEDMIRRADDKLYQAKAKGRNRVAMEM